MTVVDRYLEAQTIEGEIGLVIDYRAGEVLAVDVLQAAMGLIQSLDRLDATLLSSVNTSLEPVSVLNDVQHSSLKLLLARALRGIPDEEIRTLEWKKWIGRLLTVGKHKLLLMIDADSPDLHTALIELQPLYQNPPAGLIGYEPPSVSAARAALDEVTAARARLPGQRVVIQTENGDIDLPDRPMLSADVVPTVAARVVRNQGTEIFKVKSPDYIGTSQWTVIRGNRNVRVDMLHKAWLDRFRERQIMVLPGDSLECRYEEEVAYDESGDELERHLSIIEVIAVRSPPSPPEQKPLMLGK